MIKQNENRRHVFILLYEYTTVKGKAYLVLFLVKVLYNWYIVTW